MRELVKPNYHTNKYDPEKCVAIRDRWQQYLYVKNGAKPHDIFVSIETEDMVMVFDKEETKELYEKYRKYELR